MADHKLHVILQKEELDPHRLIDKVVVVIDALFATTSMVTALAQRAEAVLPALDEAEARALAGSAPRPGQIVLSGEYAAVTLPGFVDPTPLALIRHGLAGKTLVFATTNGTVAVRRAAAAHAVYVGCLRNARATVQHIAAVHPDKTVLIVCAGSAGRFNLEDFYTAGWFVRHLTAVSSFGTITDTALAAARCGGVDGAAVLSESRIGRWFSSIDEDEVAFAGETDVVDLVAQLVDGRIVRVNPLAR